MWQKFCVIAVDIEIAMILGLMFGAILSSLRRSGSKSCELCGGVTHHIYCPLLVEQLCGRHSDQAEMAMVDYWAGQRDAAAYKLPKTNPSGQYILGYDREVKGIYELQEVS